MDRNVLEQLHAALKEHHTLNGVLVGPGISAKKLTYTTILSSGTSTIAPSAVTDRV